MVNYSSINSFKEKGGLKAGFFRVLDNKIETRVKAIEKI